MTTAASRPAGTEAALVMQKEEGGEVLELRISMEAPVITLPRNSEGRDAVIVDLGSLRLTNSVAWREPGALLVEEDVVALDGLAARVAVDGVAGDNIVREYDEGMQIQIQRALQDAHAVLPKTAVSSLALWRNRPSEGCLLRI